MQKHVQKSLAKLREIAHAHRTGEQLFNQILFWVSERLLNKPCYPLNAPTVAKIEITNRCNLTCRMCLRESFEEKGDMDLKTYKKIIDILPKSIACVNLTGFGEPLLHRDIIEMIRFARFQHKHTEIYTNATILDEGMSRNLLASGLGSLHFSIDGTTKNSYEYLRLGAKYDEVLQNIVEFMELRKRVQNPPDVTMRVVITRENLHETCGFIELAHKLGINNVRFQALQFFWGCGISKPEHSIHFMTEINEAEQIFKNALEKAQKLGVQLKLPTIVFSREIRCLQPWWLIFVNWQGFVIPCCAVYDVHVGNILNQSFEKIWKGRKLVTWRRQMKSSSPPMQCRNCCSR